MPDSSIGLDYILQKATSLIDGLVVYPERMLENLNATRGLIFSGQLLLALTQKGIARETAYEWVQRNAMKSGTRAQISASWSQRTRTSPRTSVANKSIQFFRWRNI